MCEDEIQGCVACSSDMVCTECVDGMFPDATGKACMLPFANCLVDQPDGLLAIEVEVEVGGETQYEWAYYCPQCDEGYTFDW